MVFISFQHDDRDQARGFALLQWNRYVDFEFRGRHLLSPVNSSNELYIRSRIRDMMNGTSVTAVLIGQNTKESDWVKWEIEESMARGNGIIGIRLKGQENAEIPDVLTENGYRVINWDPSIFSDEVERCALIAGRMPQRPPRYPSSVLGSCARPV